MLVCCSSEENAKPRAEISVSPDAVTTSGDAATITLTVTSDREWSIYCTESWAACSPTGGLKGSGEVTLTVSANDSQTESRAAEIVVKSGSTRLRVPLTQQMAVRELTIADANLNSYLLAHCDADNDGVFSNVEAAALTTLAIPGLEIASFAELPNFTGLTSLDCSANSIPELNLKALTALTSLDCANNELTELDIKTNTALTTLDCTGNEIDKIYVWSGFTAPAGFRIPANAQYVLPDMFIPDGYKLIWSDEFEGSALDTDNWTAEIGNGSGGWGNAELEYYTDRSQNVKVENGSLVITAVKETYSGFPATSARLITLDKVTCKYGYIVASIKLPKTADGLWPAFWMMGNDFSTNGWPKCGETDILEMGHADGIKAGTQDRFLNGACHWGQSYANHVTYDYSLQDGEFHTFTCVWDKDYIRMYIDLQTHPEARPYFEMKITDEMGNDAFRKENFLLLNLAVGGNFPGIHDIGGVTGLSVGSASMYVDYVRIFQKK